MKNKKEANPYEHRDCTLIFGFEMPFVYRVFIMPNNRAVSLN